MLYRFGDLLLTSELPLSQLPLVSGGLPECRLHESDDGVAAAPTPGHWDHHWRAPGGAISLSCARAGGGYRLDVPSLGTFDVDEEGRSVTWRLRGEPGPHSVEHGLVDHVLPRVLVQRGRLVLHGGAVEAGGGALVFLGDSGRGKSTLCAALGALGCRVLGDDGLVIRPRLDGGFDALATYPGLRLLPESLEHLFGPEAAGIPVDDGGSKQRLHAGTHGFTHADEAVPVRAVFALDESDRISIETMPGREAFVSLVRSSFHLHLGDPDRSATLFMQLGALLDAVPVRRLSYPRNLHELAAVCDAVLGA